MDQRSKVNKSGDVIDNDHVEMQKRSISTADMETTFDPLVCKRLKLKADCILIPLLSLAYLFKYVKSTQIYYLLENINALLTASQFLGSKQRVKRAYCRPRKGSSFSWKSIQSSLDILPNSLHHPRAPCHNFNEAIRFGIHFTSYAIGLWCSLACFWLRDFVQPTGSLSGHCGCCRGRFSSIVSHPFLTYIWPILYTQVLISFSSQNHLLPIHLVYSQRIRQSYWCVLCCTDSIFGFWRPPRIWHVSDRGWSLFPLVIPIFPGRRVDYSMRNHYGLCPTLKSSVCLVPEAYRERSCYTAT